MQLLRKNLKADVRRKTTSAIGTLGSLMSSLYLLLEKDCHSKIYLKSRREEKVQVWYWQTVAPPLGSR